MEKYKDRRNQLANALRSDKYEQGRLALRIDDKFCCLGVACDVYMKETGNGKWGHDNFSERYYYGVHMDVLPDDVMEYYGFYTNGVECTNDTTLLSMNDNGMLFSEIADIIDGSNPHIQVIDSED